MVDLIRRSLYGLTGVLLIAGLASCDGDVLTQTNPNELSTETYYANQAQAESAVYAAYANFQTLGLYVRRYYFVHDLLSNEVEGMNSLEGDLNQFNTHNFNPGSNGTLSEIWKALGRGIQRANLVIQNVPETEDISDAARQQFIAEAKFIRAWHLYEQVTTWGEVPVVVNENGDPIVATQQQLQEGVPKMSKEQIYSLILSDLNDAEEALPLKSEYSEADKGRATAAAAAALKGKVHLARSASSAIGTGADAWSNAESEFEKFTGGGAYASEYSLVDNYFDNFKEETENNDESIFEVQFAPTGNANWSEQGSGDWGETFRNQEYTHTAWRNVIPSKKLVEEYESDDPRAEETIYFACQNFYDGDGNFRPIYTPTLRNTDGDIRTNMDPDRPVCPHPDASSPSESVQMADIPDNLPNFRKYQKTYRQTNNVANQNSGINFRVIRLADVFLSLADAKIELGKLDEARQLINRVRQRPSVDMDPYDSGDLNGKQEHLDALYHEVAVEHAGEQVLHKFQQRRPAYLDEWANGPEYDPQGVGGEVDAGYGSDCVTIPFPQQEIDANNALSSSDQNSCGS